MRIESFNAEELKKKAKTEKTELDNISKLEQFQESIKREGKAWEKLIENIHKLKIKKTK